MLKIFLSEGSGIDIKIVHISAEESVSLVAAYPGVDLPVIGEITRPIKEKSVDRFGVDVNFTNS